MKYFKLSILLTVIGLGIFFANNVFAATEFVSIIDPDNGAGTDYTSLSAWEQAIQSDLSATTTTLVFSYTTASGTIPDLATVQGETSGATATSTHMASSSNQILLTNISGVFQAGETIYIQGQATSSNYIISDDNGDSVIAVAKCRSTGGSPDTTAVTIDGWTTSATNYIKVWTDPDDPYGRHNGKWDDEKYRIRTTGRFVEYTPITINDDFVFIEGLQLDSAYDGQSGADYQKGIYISNTGASIFNNIIKKFNTGQQTGICFSNIPNGGSVKIYNNIIYDFMRGIYSEHRWSDVALSGVIYNNTVYNSGVSGISVRFNTGNGGIALRNNLVQGSTDNDYYITNFNTTSNNISEDTTSPDGASYQNLAVNFIDETNNDFHLSPTDTSAKNAGTSLFFDATSSFSTDIDGTSRGGAWDIGADELPVEFVSTICQATTTGGNCVNMDYNSLGGTGNWEDKVESDLTASTTRVFSGTITGTLNENTTVNLCNGSTDLNIDGVVVATTSDQILIDNITGTTTPLVASSSWLWSDEACDSAVNYWTISGTGDDLGASPIAVAMIDGAWSVADENYLTIGGWTTDNDNYIKVYTTDLARHHGKWDENKYRNEFSVESHNVKINESYTKIEGLQIKTTTGDYNYKYGVYISDSEHKVTGVKISHNIIREGNNSYRQYGRGIIISSASFAPNYIFNNIIYDFSGSDGTGISSSCSYGLSKINYVYNNTIYNCITGIYTEYNHTVAKNNIVASTTDPFYGTFFSGSDYNTTDIDDDTAGEKNTPQYDYKNQTFTFVDVDNNDFHLAQTDVGAQSKGTDLSSDANLNFTTDIDGGTRIGSWDIGADQLSEKIYRSVGNDSSDLNTDSRTVTISGTTATFSDTMPDNIGVGDIIQYGGAGYYQIAVISGRSSSTEYKVQSYDLSSSLSATTTASASVYRAHLTLNDWETQTLENVNSGISDDIDDYVLVGQDLVASNTIMMTACYASDNGDTEAVNIDGWTTGVDNYIKVYTPVNSDEVGVTQRHNGKWDEGKYRLKTSESGSILFIQENYTKIDGLQIENTYIGSINNAACGIIIYNGYSDTEISNNIIKKTNIHNSFYNNGIRVNNSIKIWNNIVYNFYDNLDISTNSANQEFIVYNNTIYNALNNNILTSDNYTTSTYYYYKNNIALNSGTKDFVIVFMISHLIADYNISSDDTAPGINSKTNTTVNFIDSANNDFHLSPLDTSAKNAGTNLSSDSNLSFTDDIDGNTRYDVAWDIGADETTTILYRSVGNDTNDLNINSATTTISTTTATFSIDMPAKIGVGDVLQYGFPLQLGFITARTSSTTYEIQNRLGALPTATTSASVSIFRAHEFLDDWEDQVVEDVNDGIDESVDDLVLINNMDLTASNTAMFVPCYASTSADNLATVVISGWTTATSSYIKIYTPTETSEVGTSQRHSGIRDNESYRLEIDAAQIFKFFVDDIKIEGLQIIGSSTNQGFYIHNSDYQFNIDISHNIITRSHTTGGGYGIYMGQHKNGSIANISNNLIYNWGTDTSECVGVYVDGDWAVNVYNNTISNIYRCVYKPNTGTVIAKNNAVFNCVDDFYGSITIDYNASDDLDGANAIDISPCPVEEDCWKGMFMDYENYDFRIKNANSVLYNSGTTISSVTDDILGIARPQHGIYDVGAFEYSNSTPKYKFKGGKFKLKGKIKFK